MGQLVIQAIKERIKRLYLLCKPSPNFLPIRVKDRYETLKFMEGGGSIIRFGDGEFSILAGKNAPAFQKASKKLLHELNVTLKLKAHGVLICIPAAMTNDKEYQKLRTNSRFFLTKFLSKNYSWLANNIPLDREYGDSLLTRFYLSRYESYQESKNYIAMVKKLFTQRNVVIIEGEKTRFGVGNDLLNEAKDVSRILCPSVDAFSYYDEILNFSLKLPMDSLYLVALGPTAKILARDLALSGRQVWDLGHLDIEYEWFLHKVKFKSGVPGKYVNEVNQCFSETEELLQNKKYLAEIVHTIGS